MDHRVTYSTALDNVDWAELKRTLNEDDFDNGRSPEQLRQSAEHSAVNVFAWADGKVIGTVRVLSDWVCNAYVVDVWTYSPFRQQGVATHMMQLALEPLAGQHVYLFTDDAVEFYRKLWFREGGVGMGRVIGTWLQHALPGSVSQEQGGGNTASNTTASNTTASNTTAGNAIGAVE